MSWSYWLCDTITGDKLLEVEPASGSWSRLLNISGSGRHTFVPGALDADGDRLIDRATWRDATTPWACTLVQCWDDVPVYAGVITGRPYDRDTQMLTLNHTDLRSLFTARFTFGAVYWEDEDAGIPGHLTITSKSLVSAVGLVLQNACITPVGFTTDYSVPLVLPSLVESGTYTNRIDNFNFVKVTDFLSELQEMDGGPDVEFAPQWSGSDKLEWVVRAGGLTGGTFDFDLSDPACPVSSARFTEDALKQVTGVIGIGEGFGAEIVAGGQTVAQQSDAEIPARDEVVPWRMVKSIPYAASLATGRLATYKYPTTQPALTVLASEVSPLDLVLGSIVTVTDSGDPFLLDGPTEYRLVGLSGGVGLEVQLSVQEVHA